MLSYKLISHEVQANLISSLAMQFKDPVTTQSTLTYGATPATVGIIPLYNARTPPSVLYIVFNVANMPGNLVPGFPKAANDAD